MKHLTLENVVKFVFTPLANAATAIFAGLAVTAATEANAGKMVNAQDFLEGLMASLLWMWFLASGLTLALAWYTGRHRKAGERA